MNISLSDIKLICNYKENSNPSLPKGIIYYLDTLSSEDEWVINEAKRRNRQSAINSLLDEEQEDYTELPWPIPEGDLSNGTVLSPRVMSQSVTAKNFIDYNYLYDDIISHLENITSKPMKKCQIHPYDINLKLTNGSSSTNLENFDSNLRKIITKMTFLKNILSMKSRLGPGSVFIIGDNILDYLISSSYEFQLNQSGSVVGVINGSKIIHSSNISPNKVIATVTQNESSTGLNVINNVNNGDDYHQTYFISETPTFENRIVWFEIS